MKEFISILISFIFMSIADNIDLYSRSIVYRLVLSKLYKRENLPIRRNGDETLNV